MPYNPFSYQKRKTLTVDNIGNQVPVVIADFMQQKNMLPEHLEAIGYSYNAALDKWNIADAAADYLYCANAIPDFNLPGTLKVICNFKFWKQQQYKENYFPLFTAAEFLNAKIKSEKINFVSVDVDEAAEVLLQKIKEDATVVLCIYSSSKNAMQKLRSFVANLMQHKILCPVVIAVESYQDNIDDQLIDFSTTAGGLFLDGMGDGIWLMNDPNVMLDKPASGRTYLPVKNNYQFLNNTSFSILQAVRTRISKTEYISCPSCGRTLFDLQETTAKIRKVTHHLKGLKIAIMGCIVNGPGEMADADFGYVGSGANKITLYRGKEVVKKNINSEVAVEELINLLKESGVWIESELVS